MRRSRCRSDENNANQAGDWLAYSKVGDPRAIARQLDIPLNTAASRYRYALDALRKELTAADYHG